MAPETPQPVAERTFEPKTGKRDLEKNFSKEEARSRFKSTSGLHVVQIVDKATGWTGTWSRSEINQVDIRTISGKGRFSHGCASPGPMKGYVFDLTEGYDLNKEARKYVVSL